MKIDYLFKNYFNFFKDSPSFQKNTINTNLVAIAKIVSYFALSMTLGSTIVSIVSFIYSHLSHKETLSSTDQKTKDQAKQNLHLSEVNSKQDNPLQVHLYTGDFRESENSKVSTNLTDTRLQVTFNQYAKFRVTIRREDIFNSSAQVIVNAANKELAGGGGIDGAIHTKGGSEYQEAHKQLKAHYSSQYVSGYASLINSGSLKQKYRIENVIVVVGPQGPTSDSQKENELYSCYYNSLCVAEIAQKTSIAFPSISTGIFKFPKQRAACISLKAIYDFIRNHPNATLTQISIHFLPTERIEELQTYEQVFAFQS